MSAYYNENDEQKAVWLRELIRTGTVAPGEVDTRSIKEVQPEDLAGFTQYHFFAGIGVWSYALRLAGWPDDRPVWTGSCPCPSFSAAGKGGGFNDPRHLWPDWARLIRKRRPATLFGEQADDAIGYGWLDLVQTDLERENYAVGKAVLGACSVGAPHIRQRLYFVAKSLHAERWSVNDGRANGRDGQDTGRTEAYGEPRTCGEVRSVANSDGRQSSDGDVQRSGEHGQRQAGAAGGLLLGGFWRDAEWLWCRDGKYRPVEPGTFPLVAGATNRVLKLRGYGDALCAEVAKAFIEASTI